MRNNLKYYLSIAVIISISKILIAQECPEGTSEEWLHGNSVKTMLLNGGDMWWNLSSARYSVPFHEDSINSHVLFAGATWIGGIDEGGKLRLAAQTYRQLGDDFWPGPLTDEGEATFENCHDFNDHYKVTSNRIEIHKKNTEDYDVRNGGTIPISSIHTSILNWPAAGNKYFLGKSGRPLPFAINDKMAPFINYDGKPGYDPTKGDYPDIKDSKEGVFWVINDQLHKHTASSERKGTWPNTTPGDGGLPLGMEIRKLAYAYDTVGVLDSTTFYQFEYEAKKMALDSFYISIWVDNDVGNPFDDYVGCDTNRNLAIGYNGDVIDEGANGYGENPPFVGVDFLKLNAPGMQPDLGMTSFMYYNNDFTNIGNPETPSDYYGYMQGLWKDSTYPTNPAGHAQEGQRTSYMFYSEPNEISPGVWSECADSNNPFDRRFVMSTGPYSLEKGETITLDFAVIFARCSYYESCPSFDCIQNASDEVQAFFDDKISTSVERVEGDPVDWQIRPNPASDYFQVELAKPLNGEIRITDLTGKILEERSIYGRQSVRINTVNFSKGVYLVQLKTKQGQTTRKVIIGN